MTEARARTQRRKAVKAKPKQTADQRRRRPARQNESKARNERATQRDGQSPSEVALDPSARVSNLAIEQAKPTFETPAMPETQLSPEEQAKRKAELEAAKEKFDQADSAGGTVEAVKDMPPSAKAMHQGSMGAKVGEVVAADQKKFEAEAPKIEARMGGEQDVGEVPKVEAPAIGEVKLAEGQVAPTQKPDLPPTADPQTYQGNKEVKTLMDKFFSLFGFGKDSIDKSFKEVNTGDDIETSPGPKPKVPRAKGTETDDERIDRDKAQSKQESEKAGLAAQQKILDGPGPEQAKTREHTESRPLPQLQRVESPTVVAAEGAQSFQQIAAREDESLVAQFDKDQHESMQQSLVEAQRKTAEAETERDTKRKEEMDKADAERKAVEEKADTDQKAKVLEARKTIQTERQKTVDAQAAEVKSVEKESEDARKEERGKIKKRVEDDEKAISTKYDEKEGEAKKELKKGEDKAAKEKEKSEKESENQSWWDRAKSWVKEQFAKLTAVIGKIFDAVRSLVKKALDAARKFAKDLIDAAAAFIKKAIEAFGELVKGLVNVLVGTFFPDLAKKLNEAIDSAVALAKKGVDFVAEQMKKGVDAIVDALQKGIDAVLNAFQGALNFAISLVQAALTGDWGAVFKQLLEAALKLLGIDPKAFYAFIAKVQETLGLIVDKPGQFLSNVLGAVKLGFSLFAGNFLKHLKAGIVGWLTGSLGGDIQIPKTFNLLGILDLVRQLLGFTWDWLKKRAAKIIGEKNVERLEYLFSYVDTLRKEGWGGLFKRLQEDLTGLKEKVLGEIGQFLTVQVIKAAVLWLAGLFNPVGALVKVVMTVWNIYTFLRDQLSRMIQVVKTVVGALDKIARGVIEEAGKKVESVLGLLIPVAIDLLAKLLGLTGVTAKVRSILKAVNQSITKTVDKVLKKVAAKFKGRGKGKGKGGGKGKDKKLTKQKTAPFSKTIGKRLPIPLKKGKHHLHIVDTGKKAQIRMESTPKEVRILLAAWKKQVANLPDSMESNARTWIADIEGVLTPTQEQADLIALARERTVQAPREVRNPKSQGAKEARLKKIEDGLSDEEQLIVDRLKKLVPMLEVDQRDFIVRFQKASAIKSFSKWVRAGDWDREWSKVFGLAKRNAEFDRAWGQLNGKIEERQDPNDGRARQVKLKGASSADPNLLKLATELVVQEGKTRPQFKKPGGFDVSDIQEFIKASKRLPHHGNVARVLAPKVLALLLKQKNILASGAAGKYRFPDLPPQRHFPASWLKPGIIRETFYEAGSGWASAKKTIQQRDMPRFEGPMQRYEAALAANDKAGQDAAEVEWEKLRAEGVGMDADIDSLSPAQRSHFVRSTPGSGAVNGNYFHVDHGVPVAQHWSSLQGNNTRETVRQKFNINKNNLKLAWHISNLTKNSAGARFHSWVGPKFTSQYQTNGDVGIVEGATRFVGM